MVSTQNHNDRRSPRGHGETILFVEDDAPLRNLGRRIMEASGYRVLEAANGDEAVERARAYPDTIDMMVTDMIMPKMSGQKVAQRIAELYEGIPVLYVSGYFDDATIQDLILTSEVHFLSKPFTPDGLLRKIRDVLGGEK